jgi:hypothetical protein
MQLLSAAAAFIEPALEIIEASHLVDGRIDRDRFEAAGRLQHVAFRFDDARQIFGGEGVIVVNRRGDDACRFATRQPA